MWPYKYLETVAVLQDTSEFFGVLRSPDIKISDETWASFNIWSTPSSQNKNIYDYFKIDAREEI